MALNLADRTPPQDLQAEKCVLASMMLDRDCVSSCRSILGRDDLFLTDHQHIFDALASLADSGKPIDAVLLRDELVRRGKLDEVGGTHTIAEMLNSIPSSAHAEHYAKIVKDKSILRSMIRTATEVIRDAYEGFADPLELNQRMLDRAAAFAATKSSIRISLLEEVLHEVYEECGAGGATLYPLGFPKLDDWLGGGVAKGELVIIAGWPSHGKSAFAKNVGMNFAAAGMAGGFVTLEESAKKIARDMLAAESGVPGKLIRSGQGLSRSHFSAMGEAIGRLAPRQVWINENDASLAGVCNAVNLGVAKHGWKWAVIDHADLIDLNTVRGEGDTSRHDQISRTLSRLRSRLGIVLIVIKQLVKPGNVIRKPTPGDLRASGAYQQDADVILLVDSDDVHHREDPSYQQTRITTVSVSKARSGTGGMAELKWDGSVQRFGDPPVFDPF